QRLHLVVIFFCPQNRRRPIFRLLSWLRPPSPRSLRQSNSPGRATTSPFSLWYEGRPTIPPFASSTQSPTSNQNQGLFSETSPSSRPQPNTSRLRLPRLKTLSATCMPS